MTIHNLDGAIEAEKLGFKRAVLSRELSLDEIKNICDNTNIEIETFIHGALCISYSGQCLFSSLVGGRSGNRGRCAQPCRLPYTLIEKDNKTDETKTLNKGYLLSTRDLMGLEYIPSLIDAGVMCFKIEGRMKSPEYVATVTRIYRKYIDLALSNEPYEIDDKDIEDLKQVFNRGGFSSGHLKEDANRNLVYEKKQNHMGIYIGDVSNIKQNKGHIFLKLTSSLFLGDTIEFEKENSKYTISELMIKGKNVLTANLNDYIEIGRMKGNINIGDKIYKVASKELSSLANQSYQNENKKISLNAHIILKKNKPIELTVSTISNSNPIFNDINISETSEIVPVEAKNQPITKEKIIEQLSKTNDTIFNFDNIDIDLEDNLFLPSIKSLNELRRLTLDKILKQAQNNILRNSNFKYEKQNLISNNVNTENRSISLLLNILEENFDYSKIENIDNIYIPFKYFSNKKYEKILTQISNKYNLYIYLPTISKNRYNNIINTKIDTLIDKFNVKGIVFSNLGNILLLESLKNKYGNKLEFIGNYSFNVYNSISTKELKNLDLNKLTLSPELDLDTLTNLSELSNLPQELIVYGRTPLMNINYCLLGRTNKCYSSCTSRCMEDKLYYLKDRMGLDFLIVPDNSETITTIYNSKITSINGSNFNVSSYRIDILNENIDEINNIIDSVLNNKRLEGLEYTNGNLNREI